MQQSLVTLVEQCECRQLSGFRFVHRVGDPTKSNANFKQRENLNTVRALPEARKLTVRVLPDPGNETEEAFAADSATADSLSYKNCLQYFEHERVSK